MHITHTHTHAQMHSTHTHTHAQMHTRTIHPNSVHTHTQTPHPHTPHTVCFNTASWSTYTYCIGTKLLHPSREAMQISPFCEVLLIWNNDSYKRGLNAESKLLTFGNHTTCSSVYWGVGVPLQWVCSPWGCVLEPSTEQQRGTGWCRCSPLLTGQCTRPANTYNHQKHYTMYVHTFYTPHQYCTQRLSLYVGTLSQTRYVAADVLAIHSYV